MALLRFVSLGATPRKLPLTREVVEINYRAEHLANNRFADLKDFRGVSTRYSKLGERYAAFVSLAAWHVDTR